MSDRAGTPGARPAVEFEVVTLFPEIFPGFLAASLLGKAIETGLIGVRLTNLREHGLGKHRSVDDSPYGGGAGMVLRPEPVASAIESALVLRGPAHRILLAPHGRRFDQDLAARLAIMPRILLVCGRYEGVDDRVGEGLCDDVVSVGDYVLSGGELAAAVLIDAVARLVPGVIGKAESAAEESFTHARGRLEYPHYTRPPVFRDMPVPAELQSGNHAQIARYRRRAALLRTLRWRPDLLERYPPDEAERVWLAEKGEKPKG